MDSLTSHTSNAGLMLVQRRRRCTNIKPALVKRAVFSGEWFIILIESFEEQTVCHLVFPDAS